MSFTPIEGSYIPSQHPVALYASYFSEKQTSHGWMHAHEHDPTHVPQLMPWVMVLESTGFSTRQAEQYRYRFFGTECVGLAQCDLTGRMLGEEIEPKAALYRRREFSHVKAIRAPRYAYGAMPIEGRGFQKVLTGVFPVSTERKTDVDRFHVVVASDWVRLAS